NVIDLMEEQKHITNMGATMRLGAYDCILKKGTLAYRAYGKSKVQERHRHRYEFNNEYREKLCEAGLRLSGLSENELLVEILEYPANRFHIGVQFHPEFKSRPNRPHPLFIELIKAAVKA
ncbi:MAG TPA: CTP synthase, partial [Candidatus Cloacimonas sp.]|nr:CTP synthase [Candidatus Cloacimonas sp.]